MEKPRIKVLYIAGNTRSGSTILHNLLAQLEGFVGVGEVRDIWEFGFLDNRLCGCGQPFAECEFWQSIVKHAFDEHPADAGHLAAISDQLTLHHLPQLVAHSVRQRDPEVTEYMAQLQRLYEAIHRVNQGCVIIDSSKHPIFAYLVQRLPGLEVYIVHLVRDSRGVSYSWTKKKELVPGTRRFGYMQQYHPIRSAVQWDIRVILAEWLLRVPPERYMRLRYEDFVDNPRKHVERLVHFLGEAPSTLPFVDDHTVEMSREVHSLYGNPVRFSRGAVTVKRDDAWRTELRWWDRLLVTALTWPLLWWLEYLPFLNVG